MYKKWILSLMMGLLSLVAAQATPVLKADHPARYVVQKSDTLWDISGHFLRDPWLWPEIWQVNPQINNPHLIYPGDVLVMTLCDGRPCLKLERTREVKLSPGVRSSLNDRAIPPIPLDVIRPFLSRPRVVSEHALALAPYVLSSQDEHLIAGENHRVYVRNLDEASVAPRYTVYRAGDAYRDFTDSGEQNGEILGYEAIYVADAETQRLGDPATFLITQSDREVLVGDRLMEEELPIDAEFIPHAPNFDVAGRIVSVLDGVSQIAQYQVVVINLGEKDGMKAGHVLSVNESGRYVRDPIAPQVQALKAQLASTGEQAETATSPASKQATSVALTHESARYRANHQAAEEVALPEERIGEVMVFRTFERVSYALVMHLERPAHVGDTLYLP